MQWFRVKLMGAQDELVFINLGFVSNIVEEKTIMPLSSDDYYTIFTVGKNKGVTCKDIHGDIKNYLDSLEVQ